MKADPNEAVAACTEYAVDHLWVASHLMQLAGVTFMVAALLFLALQLESVSGRMVTRRGRRSDSLSGRNGSATTVDGIALKAMVDAWAVAPAAQKEPGFHAALAIRQVEIGLASMVNLLFGLTVNVYGVALLVDPTYPKWLGGLAIVGGLPTMIAGVLIAYTGFSGLNNGYQYAGEFPAAGLDAHGGSLHVAARRSSAG